MTRSDGNQEGRDPMPASTRRQENPRPASTRKIAGRTTQARSETGTSPGAGGNTESGRKPESDKSTESGKSADTGEVAPTRRMFGPRRSGSKAPQDSDTDAGDGGTDARDEAEDAPTGRSRGVSTRLAVAGIVVGLLAAGAGAFLATNPGIDRDNAAFVDRATTEEVAGLAATHAQRLVAIDHTELDAYYESLDEFLAPQLVEELDQTWDALTETYEQTQTVVDAQTQNAGVSFLTEDRAEVLLILNVSMERDGVAAGSTSGTYLVELTRMDGTWKLSSIPDLPS